jgi:hypothetical protein
MLELKVTINSSISTGMRILDEFFNGKTPEPGSDDGGYDSSPADEAIGAPWAVSMPIC